MSPVFGKLTLSGLLYEGSDFEAWRVRLDASLYIHDLSDFDSTHTPDPKCTSAEDSRARSASDLLCASVSPHILSRIPQSDRLSPSILWKRLKSQTTPFRFLDLPDAARASTYKLACWQDVENVEISTPLPPITAVCRQLRQESRAACYAGHEFYIAVQRLKPAHANRAEWIEDRVRAWAEKSLGDGAQYLRRLTLPYCYNYRITDSQTQIRYPWLVIRNIMVKFSPEDGVRIQVDPNEIHYKSDDPELMSSKVLTDECEEMLRNYALKVNKDRKTFRLKGGEAILWAMLGKPEMWDDGVFKWCDP